jgi:hypothetical protein
MTSGRPGTQVTTRHYLDILRQDKYLVEPEHFNMEMPPGTWEGSLKIWCSKVWIGFPAHWAWHTENAGKGVFHFSWEISLLLYNWVEMQNRKEDDHSLKRYLELKRAGEKICRGWFYYETFRCSEVYHRVLLFLQIDLRSRLLKIPNASVWGRVQNEHEREKKEELNVFSIYLMKLLSHETLAQQDRLFWRLW